jgi:hypothetical protein
MKLLLALCLLLTSCVAESRKPHIDLLAGVRDFDSDRAWEQTDSQAALGVQIDYAGKNDVGPEFAFISSNDLSTDDLYVNRSVSFTRSRIEEVSMGVRKSFDLGNSFQGYVSGGLSLMKLRTTAALTYADARSDTSQAVTPYAQAGLNYFLDSHYSCGILYRRTFLGNNEDIFVNEPPTDSNLLMLSIGYSF